MEKTKITQKQKLDLIVKCRSDILFFVEECILKPTNEATGSNYFITSQQKNGLLEFQALVHDKIQGKRQDILGVSVMSGKGTGKDAATAWIIQWFMFCFPNPKIPCISVSADQLNKVLWSEISKWLTHSTVKEFFALQTEKFYRVDIDDSSRGKRWFAFTKAANPKMAPDEQIESLAGIHEDYLLQIVDEGSGVPNLVYETLENNMTGFCNLMWVIFNPMHPKGYAVDTQFKDKDRWVSLRWSSEESEITNKIKQKKLEDKFGRDSNTYRMNVLGLPPLFNEETLINYEWVMEAVTRRLTILPTMPLVGAMDCGAGGDNSIIASKRGNKCYPFKKFSTADSTELVNWAGHYIDVEEPDVFRVDTIGIGWAVEGSLNDKKGSLVESADSRRMANNSEMFVNKRAEMFWNLREMFERGTIEIPDDPDLLDQLAALKYETNNKGQIVIMDKRALKKEIGTSPNEADALAMLFYEKEDFISKKTHPNRRRSVYSSGTTYMAG